MNDVLAIYKVEYKVYPGYQQIFWIDVMASSVADAKKRATKVARRVRKHTRIQIVSVAVRV